MRKVYAMRRLGGVVTKELVARSVKDALALIGLFEAVMAIGGLSLTDILPVPTDFTQRVIVCFVVVAAISVICGVRRYYGSKNGINIEIAGNEVNIIVDDLFKQDGIKLIPFNEFFDTKVDDIVISENSLNGQYVEHHANKQVLNQVISSDTKTTLPGPFEAGGRKRYPLGTIKLCEDYALLALTHMDDFNRAYLSFDQYEQCLLNMWIELDRVYAGKQVVIPLLGSGITRFKGQKPSEDDLLRCMLCTLSMSGCKFKSGVLIALAKNSAARMRLYDINDYAEILNSGKGCAD